MERHHAWTLLIALILVSAIGMASAIPGIPPAWYGTVMVNGSAAPDGTIVSGWIGGVEKANLSITEGGYYIEVEGSTGDYIDLRIYDAEVERVLYQVNLTKKDLSLNDTHVNESAQPDALPASITTTFVLINWTTNPGSDTTGLSHYELLRVGDAGGPFSSINETPDTTQTTYNDTGRSNGVTYYYRLQTYDKVGNVGNATDVHTTINTGESTYIPEDPDTLESSRGNYWVNYIWSAGGSPGNVTNSFNVSMNNTWTNGTTDTHMNVSVGPSGWANLSVWAWNTSGTGTLSTGCESDKVQAPAEPEETYIPPDPATLTNTTGNYWVNYAWVAITSPDNDNVTDSFNVCMNSTWTNETTDTFMNVTVGPSGWANITVWAYNASGGGTLSAGSVIDNVQAPAEPEETYIPPDPIDLTNTTCEYWVNYTWYANTTGNVTNSFNVSMNNTWTNGTTDTHMNVSVGPSGWANISVWAWNTSGTGTLSTGCESDKVQAPAEPEETYIPPDPIDLTNTTCEYWVNYTWYANTTGNVTNSFNVSMNNTWTNGTTDTHMNVSVGPSGWANLSVWAWNTSGTGTLSTSCESDEVQAPAEPEETYIPPDPITLTNTICEYWVNYTWSAGGSPGNVTNSFNVSMNDAWTNGTTDTHMNVNVGPSGWANLSVWAWNTSGTGTLSTSCESDEVQAPAVGPFHHIDVMPTSWTMNDNESRNFTATGRDQNDGKISGLVFAWSRSDAYIGSLTEINDTTTNFTAEHVGITYLTASNGSVTSGQVQVTVNGAANNTNVTNGTATVTSGDANVTCNLGDNVSGWINITAIGNATNSSEVNSSRPRYGLGDGDRGVSGVTVNVSQSIIDAMANGSTIRIRICYNDTTLAALGIDASTLAIWKYDSTTETWVKQPSTRSGTCVYVDVSHLCPLGLFGSKAASTPSGSSGGSGTYPPGWFGTPTPTVTATKTPATGTAADAPPGERVTPAQTKKTAAAKTTTPAAEGTTAETAKKDAPGFTAVFVIAGLLAVAYAMMRHRA